MCALLAACGAAPKPEPAAPKHKAHAGVYYSPQFLEASFTRGSLEQNAQGRPVGPPSMLAHSMLQISLGPPGVELYDELLRQRFDKVTRVERLDAAELAAKGIDVVVVPSLEHFDLPYGFSLFSGASMASGFSEHRPDEHGIAYRTTLQTPAGVPLASWVARGSADHRSGILLLSASRANLLPAYLKDARPKILAGFDNALPAWRDNPPARADLKSVVVAAKQDTFPGINLDALGIVALRVTAQSPAERPLVVRASDMRLRLADGRLAEPLAHSALVQAWQQMLLRDWKPTRADAINSMGNLVGDPVLNVVRSELSPSMAANTRQQTLYQLLASASFGERTLGRGEESGLVFFHVRGSLADAVLVAWIVDPAAMDGAQAEARVP